MVQNISVRTLALFAALAVACGRTSLDSWTDGARTGDAGGAPASSAGGPASIAGAPTGSSGGPTGSAGAPSDGPDFDFTPVFDQATTYAVHPSHSGSQQSVAITPPLTRIWTLPFENPVSYPVMADSRVFVSVNPADGRVGSVVEALDAASGATLWTSEPIRREGVSAVRLAYDRGLLFAVNWYGQVLAFDPATGNLRWQLPLPGVTGHASSPIAAGGAVFVEAAIDNGTRLFVLDERDGDLVYGVDRAVGGQPTLGAGKIFSAQGCSGMLALDAATGDTVWHSNDHCFDSGAATITMFHDGLLWIPFVDDGLVHALDAESGATVATLDDPSPSISLSAAGDQIVLPSFDDGNALRVFGATSGAFRWQVALPAYPRLPALTTPDTVYVLAGSDDLYLYGVDLVTRQLSWQSNVPAVPLDQRGGAGGAMAASGGRIVVAYGHAVAAFAATN
jgi:outer membrane protein assembly factor BamB